MTDGILLAEIQRDRMLRRYDTLIIDEAHERSLNIDFLLGYIHRAAASTARPEADRHLGDDRHAAVQRTLRRCPGHHRRGTHLPRRDPLPVRSETMANGDQVQAVCAAVDELSHEGPGDVLVFLSGEREIHDTADALRRLDLRDTEVLPLYARLSSVEQHRIFQSHRGRRIVLSTNVAETSLTVPGVRYVVDTGTARISRYSHRLKVQRLPIEPVSQASANQRAGRCGRVAPGICIRLYDEDDFADRPAFTEPEILRTNLASVILQMTNLGLGDVAAFPFIEPPDSRSIRDGYMLLDELGALQPTADGSNGDRSAADQGRPATGPPADRPAHGPDGGGSRPPRLRPRGDGHRRGAEHPGSARATGRTPSGRRRDAPPIRRRRGSGQRLHRLRQAVGPPAGAAAGTERQPVPAAVPQRVPQLPAGARVAGRVQPTPPGHRSAGHPPGQRGEPSRPHPPGAAGGPAQPPRDA